MKFWVIVCGGPCGAWIDKCLESIFMQRGVDFQVVVSLDNYDSAQGTVALYGSRVITEWNEGRIGGLANICRAVDMVEMKDDDVLVFMDADDWLLGDNALLKVKRLYDENEGLLVTCGGWTTKVKEFDKVCLCLKPYTTDEFKDIRGSEWRGTQLKTMKYVVFRNIDRGDFKDKKGRWMVRAGDHALMMPALEMAGYDRVRHCTDTIYMYNRWNRDVTDEGKINPRKDVRYIRGKKPYERLKR